MRIRILNNLESVLIFSSKLIFWKALRISLCNIFRFFTGTGTVQKGNIFVINYFYPISNNGELTLNPNILSIKCGDWVLYFTAISHRLTKYKLTPMILFSNRYDKHRIVEMPNSRQSTPPQRKTHFIMKMTSIFRYLGFGW